MSTYGYLICEPCKIMLPLGAVIDDGEKRYFHIGGSEDPHNSERPELTKALWRVVADHGHHGLRVVFDHELPDFETEDTTYVEIGGDRSIGIVDIPFDEYLEGWPG